MKQLLKEKTSRSAHVVRELQLFEPDGVVEFLIVRSFEGELATKQGVKKDTKGPNVRRWTRVLDFSHNFGCHI